MGDMGGKMRRVKVKEGMHVLVVDDEPLAREKLCRWLAAESDVAQTWDCGNGFEALEVCAAQEVDLLFLDIQMPEMDGFELLSHLETKPPVVFVTAYDRYAIDAFELHALDYLLKPYDHARFVVALERARKQRTQQTNEQVEALLAGFQERNVAKRFAVREKERIVLLDVEDIGWLEAAGNYVTLHAGERQHLIRDSLTKIEARMDPQQFLRIHRSTMVNVAHIKELRPVSHGDCVVVLRDGSELLMSRTYREKALNVLQLSF